MTCKDCAEAEADLARMTRARDAERHRADSNWDALSEWSKRAVRAEVDLYNALREDIEATREAEGKAGFHVRHALLSGILARDDARAEDQS